MGLFTLSLLLYRNPGNDDIPNKVIQEDRAMVACLHSVSRIL